MEKVSVIIPVYNAEDYLDRCLTSVIHQTYKNLEIILINDGSVDSTKIICKKYVKEDSRILLINQKNKGVSTARNVGLDKSTGDYITFIDSDDYIDENYIKILHQNIVKSNCDICVCSTCKVYSNGVIEKETLEKGILSQKEYIAKLFNSSGLGVCRNNLYRSDLIKKIRFDSELSVGEDFYFNLNVSKYIKKVIVLNLHLYYYCVNSNSLVRKFNNNYDKMYYNSSNKVRQYVENNYNTDDNLKRLTNNYIVFNLLLVIVNFVCHHDNTKNVFRMKKNIKNLLKDSLYRDALKKCNISYYDKKRKITVIALRMHFYLIVALIGMIRQHQINDI